MRQRLKNKKTSCTLCKPHKRAWETRWKAKDEAALQRFERQKEEQVRE